MKILKFILILFLFTGCGNRWKDIEHPLKKPIKGKIIAYKSKKGIYLFKGNKYKLIGEELFEPVWNKKGDKFVIRHSERHHEHKFYIYNDEGKRLKTIRTPHAINGIGWIWEENKIVYTASNDRNPYINTKTLPGFRNVFIYDLKTKETKKIFEIAEGDAELIDIRVSPDGKYIKFHNFIFRGQNIFYVVNRQGKIIYKNKKSGFTEHKFAWLPDSKHMIGLITENPGTKKAKPFFKKLNVETGEITTLSEFTHLGFGEARITADGKYYHASSAINGNVSVVMHLTGEHKGKYSWLLRGYSDGDWFYKEEEEKNFKWEFLDMELIIKNIEKMLGR